VLDRVVEQVRDQPLDQRSVADDRSALQLAVEAQPAAGDLIAALVEDLAGELVEQQRFVLLDAALAARERQQRADRALLLLADREHPLTGGAQRSGGGVWIGQADLEDRALQRQRRAQLVRGVGDELALRGERGLEPLEQLVEGVAELAQLVVGPVEREALVQVGRGELSRRGRDHLQRTQHTPGEQPAERHRGDRHDRQGEDRPDEQLMQVAAVDVGRELPELLSARVFTRKAFGHDRERRFGLGCFAAFSLLERRHGALRGDDDAVRGMAHGQEDDREQQRAEDQENAAVEDGEAQADRVAGQAQPAPHAKPAGRSRLVDRRAERVGSAHVWLIFGSRRVAPSRSAAARQALRADA
jgi:hypothetical protein